MAPSLGYDKIINGFSRSILLKYFHQPIEWLVFLVVPPDFYRGVIFCVDDVIARATELITVDNTIVSAEAISAMK